MFWKKKKKTCCFCSTIFAALSTYLLLHSKCFNIRALHWQFHKACQSICFLSLVQIDVLRATTLINYISRGGKDNQSMRCLSLFYTISCFWLLSTEHYLPHLRSYRSACVAFPFSANGRSLHGQSWFRRGLYNAGAWRYSFVSRCLKCLTSQLTSSFNQLQSCVNQPLIWGLSIWHHPWSVIHRKNHLHSGAPSEDSAGSSYLQ